MFRLSSITLLPGILVNTPAQNNITFQADLREAISGNILNPSAGDHVIVHGSLKGWNKNDYKLKDSNGVSIFPAAVDGVDKYRGAEPDYAVVHTYGDYLNGKDKDLDYTVNLISEKEQ